MHRYQPLALHGGRVYVPTMGKAPSSLLWEIDPVAVVAPEQGPLAAILEIRLTAEPKPVKEWFGAILFARVSCKSRHGAGLGSGLRDGP